MPRVSIITSLYNYAHYIGDLINSVIGQKYNDWEMIIVDDCSKDNPEKVISPYLEDKRFKYIKLVKNSGYATAKNEGVIASSGKYIIIIDADDMLCPNSVSSRVEFLDNNKKYKWLHAKAYEFGKEKPYTFTYKRRPFIKRFESMLKTGKYNELWNNIHAQTVIVKRDVYEKVGLYEETMRSMSDKEMWARIQYNVGLPAFMNQFVAYYRIHDKAMHKSKEKMKNIKFIKKQLDSFVNKRKSGNFDGTRRL